MAILIDEPRWPWRGDTWCHLVSDEDYGELHDFAGRLGMRRIGFQGDHYDLDSSTHLRALEAGAELCESRELVRRLRGAGLRRRPSQFEKWQFGRQYESLDPATVAELEAQLIGAPDVALEPLFDAGREPGAQAFTVRRRAAAAAVILGPGQAPVPVGDRSSTGLFVRSHPDGWSVEVITPAPSDDL